jgi:hypothetical protein
MLEKPL